ncbi:YlcI/YnfO family protein [Streptococcus pneumoniae]
MAFKLKSDKKETEIKTVRFPSDLVDRIEAAIIKQDVSFSSFVIQACDYALRNMEEDD